MSQRAIISGGSIGGLLAAVALHKAGWKVDVYERSDVELAGRGAGIVTHSVLLEALSSLGADLSDLGIKVKQRIAFYKSGKEKATLAYPQIVTSWDRVHRILRQLIPEGHYHLGRNVCGYDLKVDHVVAQVSNGLSASADILIGADGFRSAIRSQMLPHVKPQYAGYVVWRALANEADMPMFALNDIFPVFAFYASMGTQLIGYPIAGQDNDLRLGHRRYNLVWYARAENLGVMLTDLSGKEHDVSIPPPLIRDSIIDQMERQAKVELPNPFFEIFKHSDRPFFTPIYDHHSPVMYDGRVALVGDSACVARPHVGMGVTKAAQDALSLARHLGGDITLGLKSFSNERVPASRRAFEEGRRLGRLIFNADSKLLPKEVEAKLKDIMRSTADNVS